MRERVLLLHRRNGSGRRDPTPVLDRAQPTSRRHPVTRPGGTISRSGKGAVWTWQAGILPVHGRRRASTSRAEAVVPPPPGARGSDRKSWLGTPGPGCLGRDQLKTTSIESGPSPLPFVDGIGARGEFPSHSAGPRTASVSPIKAAEAAARRHDVEHASVPRRNSRSLPASPAGFFSRGAQRSSKGRTRAGRSTEGSRRAQTGHECATVGRVGIVESGMRGQGSAGPAGRGDVNRARGKNASRRGPWFSGATLPSLRTR